MTKFKFKGDIYDNQEGLSELARLFSITKNLYFDTVKISFKNVHWFDANLAAVLGAIISSLSNNLNNVEMIDLNDNVKKILEKMDFYQNTAVLLVMTIMGQQLNSLDSGPYDLKAFETYLEIELFTRKDLPQMSEKLTKKIL